MSLKNVRWLNKAMKQKMNDLLANKLQERVNWIYISKKCTEIFMVVYYFHFAIKLFEHLYGLLKIINYLTRNQTEQQNL